MVLRRVASLVSLLILPSVVVVVGAVQRFGLDVPLGASLLVALVVSAVVSLAYRVTLPRAEPLLVDDSGVRIPWGRRAVTVSWDDLVACEERDGDFFLYARKDVFHIRRACFADPTTGARQAYAAIRAELPNPEELDRIAAALRAANARRSLVSWGVAVGWVAAFAAVVSTSKYDGGGLLAAALATHEMTFVEPWRLIAAGVVHQNIVELIVQLLMLLIIGRQVEWFLGRSGFVLLLFGTTVAAQVVTVALKARPEAGIEVLGLLSVAGWSSLRLRGTGTGLMISPTMWAVLIAVNAIALTRPGTNVVAPIAAVVVGLAICELVAPQPRGRRVGTETQWWLALGCAIATGLAIAQALEHSA